MTRPLRATIWLASLIAAPNAHAQSCWDKVRAQLEIPAGVSTIETSSLDNDTKKCLQQTLSDPATLNRALNLLTSPDSGWSFLRDVHFALKTFEVQEATGTTRSHLGFSYDYSKSIVTTPLEQTCGDACVHAIDFHFSTQGSVAFEADVNPRDFLESHLSLAWFRSSGGAKRLSARAQEEYNALGQQMAMVTVGHDSELQLYNRQLSKLIAGNLTNQLYLEAGADISFESDQMFNRKQWVYAARAAIDFRGWSGLNAQSWQATPAAGRLNIFDYPFALIRRLTAYGPCDATEHSIGACIAPLATSWPTASAAVGQVQPSDDDPRRSLPGGDRSYTRVAFEISFKTPVAKMNDQPIYVTANYRHYRELSPPLAVKQSDISRFSYLAAAVGPQRGLFASYSTGRLPFDKRTDKVYELGFRTILE